MKLSEVLGILECNENANKEFISLAGKHWASKMYIKREENKIIFINQYGRDASIINCNRVWEEL